MHLYKTMKNFLIDFDYYIDIFKDKIHVFGFIDIEKLNSEEIILKMPLFTLKIKGNNFVVKILEKKEILIEGEVVNMEYIK